MIYNNTGSYPGLIKDILVYNRTGSSVVTGQVVQLDLSGSPQSETTGDDYRDGDPTNSWASACAVATAGLGTWLGVVLPQSNGVADNGLITVRVSGPVYALLDGTTDVVKGDMLVGVNSATNLAKAGSGAYSVARSLVAYSTNSVALKLVELLGYVAQAA